MLYRIDVQHFISHAVDYFTRDELLHLQYLIVSGTVKNLSKQENVSKVIQIYPTTEIILCYEETKNKKVLEEAYLDLLTSSDPRDEYINELIYIHIINPIMHHRDVVIVSDRDENDYIDILCKHIKTAFAIDCIDLNKLFSEGHIGPISINRDKTWNKAVDVRRSAAKKEADALATTSDGRKSLLEKMNTKEKIAKLKEIGIKVNESDKKKLDQLLIDAWVQDDEYNRKS